MDGMMGVETYPLRAPAATPHHSTRTPIAVSSDQSAFYSDEEFARLQAAGRDHLWLHFSRHSVYEHAEMPVIVKGEGAYLYDAKGKRYLDGLGGLFVNQLGHGRTDLAEAAAKQAGQLAFMPLWSYAHPKAMELAERV